jgi:hypothetical protein
VTWRRGVALAALAGAIFACGYYAPPIRPDPDAVPTPDDAAEPREDAEREEPDG